MTLSRAGLSGGPGARSSSRRLVCLVVAFGAGLLASPGQAQGDDGTSRAAGGSQLRAGVAVADITPPVGVPLGGFGEAPRRLAVPDGDPSDFHTFFAPSVGVRDPIQARALVLDDGVDRVAIVAVDLFFADAGLVSVVGRKVMERGALIAPGDILVCASHTHSGPGTLTDRLFWQLAAMDLYQAAIVDHVAAGIADAVVRADAASEPAALGIGTTELRGLTTNSRVGISPSARPHDVDPELGVIRVDRLDGQPLATIYNYAVQGLVLGPDNLAFSADLVGEASRIIEAQGAGMALFCNGAEGDARPSIGEGETALRQGGAMLAAAVLALRSGIAIRADTDVQSRSSLVDLGPPFLLLTDRRVGDGVPEPIARVLDAVGQPPGPVARLGPDIVDREFRFQAIRIGGSVIATVPGEPITEIGLEIKHRAKTLGFDHALVFGLANGHMGYITTEAEYFAGGYEGLATLYGPQTGERVSTSVWQLLREVR